LAVHFCTQARCFYEPHIKLVPRQLFWWKGDASPKTRLVYLLFLPISLSVIFATGKKLINSLRHEIAKEELSAAAGYL